MAHNAKDDRPKHVEKSDKEHLFVSLGKSPHARRSILEIDDLLGRNASGNGLILDDQIAIEDHGLIGEHPDDDKAAKLVASAHKPVHVAHEASISVCLRKRTVIEHSQD